MLGGDDMFSSSFYFIILFSFGEDTVFTHVKMLKIFTYVWSISHFETTRIHHNGAEIQNFLLFPVENFRFRELLSRVRSFVLADATVGMNETA